MRDKREFQFEPVRDHFLLADSGTVGDGAGHGFPNPNATLEPSFLAHNFLFAIRDCAMLRQRLPLGFPGAMGLPSLKSTIYLLKSKSYRPAYFLMEKWQ